MKDASYMTSSSAFVTHGCRTTSTHGSGASICDGTTEVQRGTGLGLSGTTARKRSEPAAHLPPLCVTGLPTDLRDSLA
jgi:hypothetical protein